MTTPNGWNGDALQRNSSRRYPSGRQTDMIILPVVLVLLPTMTIVAMFAWGWRHGTLAESPQERYDRQFAEIVSRI